MNHLALFNGIGGFQLAAKWAGWNNVAHVEIDSFCNKVVAYHFPESQCFTDIHNFTVDNYGNFLYLCQNGDVNMGQKKSTKYDNAVSLYDSGLSIQDCAEYFNISRQAMHKILLRRGCNMRDNLKHGDKNHFYRGCYGDNTKKKRVQHILDKAVRKGIVIPQSNCQICGKSKEFNDGRRGIQAHHSDYDKPLDVIWMCQECHHEWHKNNKPLNETNEGETAKGSHLGTTDIVLSGGFP